MLILDFSLFFEIGKYQPYLDEPGIVQIPGIEVKYVVYNDFPNDSEWIKNDSITIIRKYLEEHFPACRLLELPVIEGEQWPELELESELETGK